jgi:methionyl-tRNA synthetase
MQEKLQQNKKSFYITTTLPYVNADPHIGFAMEIIRADAVARLRRATNHDVFFNTGTDEHGSKLYEGAQKENLTPQQYVDKYSENFKKLKESLNLYYDAFIRTTDEKHILAAQKIWTICFENGDIYKKNYKTKYCIGCELEKTDSELVEGKCPDHVNKDIEIRDEENYFFRWSKYAEKLLKLYSENNNKFVIPETRQNEVKSFVSMGLQDFSISRLKSKMPWGVDVPGDSEHVMYVWFDALTSYISTLDFAEGDTKNNFEKYWQQKDATKREVVQYCGKDNNRQQSAMWQAILMSAGIENSTNIIVNGFIQSGGQKMSKSLGNVISPFDIIEKYKGIAMYPEDVLRFVLIHEVSSFEDSDVTTDSIHEAYVTHLQNGIGNQLNRVLKLSSTYLNKSDIEQIFEKVENKSGDGIDKFSKLDKNFINLFNEYKINEAAHMITDRVKKLDEYIQNSEPFKLVKIDITKSDEENKIRLEQGREIIKTSIIEVLNISHHMYFFMPRTCEFIYAQIKKNQMPEKPMFNRT